MSGIGTTPSLMCADFKENDFVQRVIYDGGGGDDDDAEGCLYGDLNAP